MWHQGFDGEWWSWLYLINQLICLNVCNKGKEKRNKAYYTNRLRYSQWFCHRSSKSETNTH